jgi:hypothetical protein
MKFFAKENCVNMKICKENVIQGLFIKIESDF